MQSIELVIVISFIAVILDCFIVSIYCTKDKLPNDDETLDRHKHWNDENKIKLLKVYYKTDTGERGHEKRIKSEWDRLYGTGNNLSAHNLYMRVTRWIKKGVAERLPIEQGGQCKNPHIFSKKMKWTPEMKEDVLRFYHESSPRKWNQSKRMKELWDRQYPDHRNVTGHNLMTQLRDLRRKEGKETKMKIIGMTKEEKMDLLHYYHMTSENRREKMKLARNLFIKNYPHYANASCTTLHSQIYYMKKRHPEIYEKAAKEVAAINTVHKSRLSGESSQLKLLETTPTPTSQTGNFPGASEQYFDPDRDNAWIDRMLQGESLPSPHLFSDVDTRDQTIHSGQLIDQHVSLNAGTSQQNLLDYPGDHFVVPDVGASCQTIPGHPGNNYASPDVPTRDKTIHSGLLMDQHVSFNAGTSQQNLLDYPGDHFVVPDAGASYQTIPGYPRNDHGFADVGMIHQSIQGHPGEHQAFPNVETNHQMIHPGNTWEQNAFLDKVTSHQTITGYSRNDHGFADVGMSHPSIQGHSGKRYVSIDVGTSHHIISGSSGKLYVLPDVRNSHQNTHSDNTWENDAFPDVRASYQTLHSGQHHLNKKQKGGSLKGKETVLN